MRTTTTKFSDAEKRMSDLLDLKNTRIGKLIIELEESRKLLNRINTALRVTDSITTTELREAINKRLPQIASVVDECTH